LEQLTLPNYWLFGDVFFQCKASDLTFCLISFFQTAS
jgi:hypothetical protein